jgi:phosphate transport system substrate-binding protein
MKYFYLLTLFCISCSSDSKAIKIKGSDTEVNLSVSIAEAFHQKNSETLISISGGGSGLGIASLLNGTTDIANSSRQINKEELSLFKKRGIQLDSFIFAQDAVAFIVSEQNTLKDIEIKDLAGILSGKVSNWKHFTKQNMEINIYGRQSNSGTFEYVKNILGIHFSPHAKQMNGNAQIIEAIKVDPSGIGYIGVGYLIGDNRKGIRTLSIYKGDKTTMVSPFDIEKIHAGEYFFQRPLYQYFKSQDLPKIKPFLDFQSSPAGADIILKSGYFAAGNKK